MDITKNIIGTYSTSFGVMLIIAKLTGQIGKLGNINFTGEIVYPRQGLGMLIFMFILYVIYLVRATKSAVETIREKGDRTNTTFEALRIAMNVNIIFFVMDFLLISMLTGVLLMTLGVGQ